MDNSATSYPKPKSVLRAVKSSLTDYCANPGRTASALGMRSSEILYRARESVARLVGTSAENIVFTYNATYALNMAILGTVKSGMTVACDGFAHNSVLRPLYCMQEKGAELVILETDMLRDSVILSDFERLVSEKGADVLVLTHTSNVTGKQLPVKQLSQICRRYGTLLIVDASQSVGSCKIDMREQGIDILASAGHKGLYGIMGTGFLAVREGLETVIDPVLSGGSGIFSADKKMPFELPERLEAGTVGLPGIISMMAGAEYVMGEGEEEIGGWERAMRTRLTEGLSDICGVRIYNRDVNSNGIVLFNVRNISSVEASEWLGREGIAVRGGFHCAPLVHEKIGRGDPDYDGAVRLSVGYFNTLAQCERVLNAVSRLAKKI